VSERLVNMHEAKTHLSRLVERVLAGDDIVIGRAGKPVARLVPYDEGLRATPRPFGLLKGKIWAAPDAFEPDQDLIDTFWQSVEKPIDE
jgi:prevent-host-death family protein